MRIKEILASKSSVKPIIPRIDLELLLAFALQKPRVFLYSDPEYMLTPEQEAAFSRISKRYLKGEPIAYITSKKEFWSLELTINKNVLIPRAATESLVEIALQLNLISANIADLGTGSGAIAIALAKERPNWHITATDISKDALHLANYNATKLKIQNIEFYYGSWCDALPDKKFDVIISNPPYIAKKDPHLQSNGIKFEPKIALEAGDGLSAIRKIITQAKTKLKTEGIIMLEHGYNQTEAVQKLLERNNYQNITHYKDLANINRVVVASVSNKTPSCSYDIQ